MRVDKEFCPNNALVEILFRIGVQHYVGGYKLWKRITSHKVHRRAVFSEDRCATLAFLVHHAENLCDNAAAYGPHYGRAYDISDSRHIIL